VHGLLSGGINVVFMWVSSHIGVTRNSAADIAAKAAVLLPLSNLTIPHSDYHSLMRNQARKKWQ